MKVCLRCGYLGDEEYCPTCRKGGKVRKLHTLEQVRFDLEREHRKVDILNDRIKQLEAG